MSTRPLLADDDAELLDIAGMITKQTEPDLEPVAAKSVKEALEIRDSEEIDFVVAGYLMPDATGMDLLEALRCASDTIGFVMWTAHS